MLFLRRFSLLLAILVTPAVGADLLMTFDTKVPDTQAAQKTIEAGAGKEGTLDPQLNASSLAFGPGFSEANTFPGRFVSAGIKGKNLEESIASQHYYSFVVSPKAGRTAHLASLSLRLYFQAGDHSGYAWGLYSSKTGFAFAERIMSAEDLVGKTGVYQYDIDLSVIPALQNLSDATEFRIVVAAPNSYLAAGLSDDTVGEWPNPPAITLTGTIK